MTYRKTSNIHLECVYRAPQKMAVKGTLNTTCSNGLNSRLDVPLM